jgi:hypothetical protein
MTYYAGQILRVKGLDKVNEYIDIWIACVGKGMICGFPIEGGHLSGNRYTDFVGAGNPYLITIDELRRLLGKFESVEVLENCNVIVKDSTLPVPQEKDYE